MKDSEILDLYWARDERALTETQRTYGAYCHSIAWHILYDNEDADECVNDTWFRAWKAIPPGRPGKLAEELQRALNSFLHTLSEKDCNVFLRRYWYAEEYSEIAERYGLKLNTVKTSLFRTRGRLKEYLQKEGVVL